MFPLKLPVTWVNGPLNPLSDPGIKEELEHGKGCVMPIRAHPGSFGFVRKNHRHEGVDLYCKEGTAVYACESGIVCWQGPFTGPRAQSPWWKDTEAVMVQGKSCSFLYGELEPATEFGQSVKEGDLIGHVKQVLSSDKGWPMSMLHLERYAPDTTKPVKEWSLNQYKPLFLWDPTNYLMQELLRQNHD